MLGLTIYFVMNAEDQPTSDNLGSSSRSGKGYDGVSKIDNNPNDYFDQNYKSKSNQNVDLSSIEEWRYYNNLPEESFELKSEMYIPICDGIFRLMPTVSYGLIVPNNSTSVVDLVFTLLHNHPIQIIDENDGNNSLVSQEYSP